MNHSATVLQEQEARLCPLARRWHCIAAARVGLGHRSALLQSTSLHFKAEGKLHCRKISAGNAATSGGGRGQTERGSEDNLPFRRERGGKVVPKPHPSKARLPSPSQQGQAPIPNQQGQAPSAQPSEGVLHLFRGRSHRSEGRDIYHPVPGLPEPMERRENQTLILGPRRRNWLLTVSQAAVSTAPRQRPQLWLNTGSTERLRSGTGRSSLALSPPWIRQIP